MDAIQFLKQQHEQAKQMFGRIEQAGAGERGRLWRQLAPELAAHEQLEEQHLYGPIAREAGGRDATLVDWEGHHHREVREAEAMIRQIDAADAGGEGWLDQVRQLESALERHIQEEEGRIWPRIRQVWDERRLEQAGQQMEAARGRRAA